MTLAAMSFSEASHPPRAGGPTLAELAAELHEFGARLSGSGAVRVHDLFQDSRRVVPGSLFVARRGARSDGARFARDAVARGAAAIVREQGGAPMQLALPVLEVSDLLRALPFAADAVHGHPTRRLRAVGVTGTNGKTTTSFLLCAALAAAGARPGRAGTLGYAFEDFEEDSDLTTPGADDLSRFAARVARGGGTHLVLEVSSHALAQHRADAMRFEAAVFTNLTQDHLDYHGSMHAYAAAKARLFTELAPALSVIDVDDAFGSELARRAAGRVVRVGSSAPADVYALDARFDAQGTHARVRLPSGEFEARTRLIGRHNLDNLLCALAVVDGLGMNVASALRGVERLGGVPGRLEACTPSGAEIGVLVDYAHTPDALARVLDAVRPLAQGRLICVFGCGGDRDAGKRPLMGRAAAERSDLVLLTNDNPRNEEPKTILDAIEAGLAGLATPYVVEPDRAAAIERAVLDAAPGDVVVIAGKGHEPYQIVGAERRPFDDRAVARSAVAARAARGGGAG
jgi:UDP-N-acetylmuramoyl-L-alanyl-D-glutamate--2,6-diaminopimelate ligase